VLREGERAKGHLFQDSEHALEPCVRRVMQQRNDGGAIATCNKRCNCATCAQRVHDIKHALVAAGRLQSNTQCAIVRISIRSAAAPPALCVRVVRVVYALCAVCVYDYCAARPLPLPLPSCGSLECGPLLMC
jgi:hypothetical protein